MEATSISQRLRGQWPAIVVLAVVALLPVGAASELPLLIGGLAGVVAAWNDRASLRFDSGVRLAVNHDGDSDSTAAMAGNLLGAVHGQDGIPQRWLEVAMS